MIDDVSEKPTWKEKPESTSIYNMTFLTLKGLCGIITGKLSLNSIKITYSTSALRFYFKTFSLYHILVEMEPFWAFLLVYKNNNIVVDFKLINLG